MKSNYLYFIISGKVHLMNHDGLLDYAVLGDGSYFGDISALFDEPNQYSYFVDQNQQTPNLFLKISVVKFLEICSKFPLSKEAFI